MMKPVSNNKKKFSLDWMRVCCSVTLLAIPAALSAQGNNETSRLVPDILQSQEITAFQFHEKPEKLPETALPSVLPVSGRVELDFYYNEFARIVLHPQSELVFTDRESSHLTLVVDELVLLNPSDTTFYRIRTDDNYRPPKAVNGEAGPPGSPGGSGCHHRHGCPGGNGKDGQPGMPGHSPSPQRVMIYVNRIVVEGNSTGSQIPLEFSFRGAQGGEGGNGGNGGAGGRGSNGLDASMKGLKCKRQAGDAGRGGMAGAGGAGGSGGNGARGSALYILGDDNTVAILQRAQFDVSGGRPGAGGIRGEIGSVGLNGSPGSRSGAPVCTQGGGSGGRNPATEHKAPQTAASGDAGAKGGAQLVIYEKPKN